MTEKRPTIPAAMRYEIWRRDMGNVIEGKCPIAWCHTQINFRNFVLAHNIPFSKGGATAPCNLRVTCASCNLSMGDRYTVDEWDRLDIGKATVIVPATPACPPVALAAPSLIPWACCWC